MPAHHIRRSRIARFRRWHRAFPVVGRHECTALTHASNVRENYFLLEYLFNVARNGCASGGTPRLFSIISLFLYSLPYNSRLESTSSRSVAPLSAIPANTPRCRDQVRISAFINASVCADDSRPTGPAATE